MHATIFGKKEDDRIRFWTGGQSMLKDGTEIRATMFVSLSKDAEKKFVDLAEETKNPDIRKVDAEISDGWLKAAKLRQKDDTAVVLFINDFTVREKKQAKKGAW